MTTTDPPTPEAGIAGAPISWGVCEVPGWGYQLGPDRVLAEMREVGLTATEFGPDGFLPTQPDAMTRVLGHHGLRAIGGFTPLLLHVPTHDPVPEVERLLRGYDATSAEVLVLSAVTGGGGYDTRPVLDDDGWMVLLANLDRLAELAASRGVRAVLHPHVGTMIETGQEVQQVLDGSWISLCLDTGHLLIGGTDPVELARGVPERVRHVHLKDVDSAVAKQAADGGVGYAEAVRAGLYRPLGHGDLEVAAVVDALESAGYHGWYVLEQDVTLDREPTPGAGPVEDVRASLDTLRSLAGRVG